jgi:transposase
MVPSLVASRACCAPRAAPPSPPSAKTRASSRSCSTPDGRLWIDRLSGGLEDSGRTLSAADGERIVRLVAHRVGAAGWHDQRSVTLPTNITLVLLPSYRPDLNPVERVWLYLRERYLSHRLYADYQAVLDACCRAWRQLTAEPDRLRSLCDYPYINRVSP